MNILIWKYIKEWYNIKNKIINMTIISRDQYEWEMNELHNSLIWIAQEEAYKINNQVDEILAFRWKKLSKQELADWLIEENISPISENEKNQFWTEIEFEWYKYLNLGDTWIMLDEIFPVQSENDFHLAWDILSGKIALPEWTRLLTDDEFKLQIFRWRMYEQFWDRYPDIFGETPYFFLHSTKRPTYWMQAWWWRHPKYGGIIISIDNTPILSNGWTSIDVDGKIPRVMKILLVRDNPLK